MKTIPTLLEEIETSRNVRILYAAESGGRAWGFASPDSDYDIRFVFTREKLSYLSVREEFESIDLPLQGLLDAGGWDIRKAARLLGKSNGALVEWLHSPIVYRNEDGFRERWQELARAVFCPRSSHAHYRGLAKQMIFGKLDREEVRAKDYLYALRAILCARWVAGGKGIPPVPFPDLVMTAPGDLQSVIPDLLRHKSESAEGELMQKIPALDLYLGEFINDEVDIPESDTDIALLDSLFRNEIAARPPRVPVGDFTVDRVKKLDLLLFDTMAGSHAYGTAVAGSDEDRRGVFVAPRSFIGGLDRIEQVSDERSDQVYYEIGQFFTLLLKNNPNALELLAMPTECVQFEHSLFRLITPDLFLSKLCGRTFGEYAMGQIRKARGLNKKIVNPQPETRRPPLDFCHVPQGQGSVPVLEWLGSRSINAQECGLTAVQHTAGLYAVYYEAGADYRGLVSPKSPDALVFSSVAIAAEPIAWMHFNQDAFRAHCKNHREYREWVELRNAERYHTNVAHGRGYDSKNLMHTLRLLEMAGEIAREGILRTRRPNREYLLQVRAGEFEYDELVDRAEGLLSEVQAEFERSSLPNEPDRDAVEALLIEIRERFA